MTTSGPTTASTAVPTATVLRRAAIAEWTRLTTVRSTWWTLAAGAALLVFIGAAVSSDHIGADPEPIWLAAQIAMLPGQFLFLMIVLLAVTGEYATGAIRSSLLWVPNRGILLAARIVVPVVFATSLAVAGSAVTGVVAWGLLGKAAEVVLGDIAASLGRIALVVGFGGLLTVGLGLFLRSTAGTLAAIFLLMLALPIALGNSAVGWLVAVSDHLPGRIVVTLIVADEPMLDLPTLATVLIGWAAAALLAGGWALIRRDTA